VDREKDLRSALGGATGVESSLRLLDVFARKAGFGRDYSPGREWVDPTYSQSSPICIPSSVIVTMRHITHGSSANRRGYRPHPSVIRGELPCMYGNEAWSYIQLRNAAALDVAAPPRNLNVRSNV